MNISETAKAVLHAEARAIASQLQVIESGDFNELATLLSWTPAKVIVTGIGKSAIAARKIAATLATCNVASVFVDPVGLFHGELGMLRSGDAVLMLSQSGETEELVRLVPVLHQKGCAIYGLIGRYPSTLGRMTRALITGVEQEPFLKVPTASSAAAVAIGDALAVEVAIRKGYTEKQFHGNHPGGYIGRTMAGQDDLIP